ncbi:hypothetical protein CSC62_14120 [Pseudoxanthomonas jiangsuensis]|uniref:tape measure protein n=1 Tax=Pseudoxanthomonas jiangsuensis TaxID=619688 RepID=UPI001390AA71|nr:tape measure protein [Pseudoxanthomonas jiangsuensis]KAF1692766.1 hypothetical protein CSC62_14120 [Pseudoxanthomonas jiangsuensis]
MTDPVVTLRLQADNSKLLPATRESTQAVQQLGAAGTAAGRQAAAGAQGIRQIGVASDQASRKASAMAAVLNQVKTAVGAVAAVQVIAGLTRMADQYANISGRLRLATESQAAFAVAQAEVYAISQRTSTALESTATLYARLAQSTAEYGISQQRQLALTETINKTFAVSGASAVAAANTITQFTQALAGGVLRAEEFNSVVENSPRLAKALADGLGIGMGELRAQVNAGLIDVQRLVQALESQSAVIAAEFESMPLTVERAMVQLRNSITQAAGQASQDFGVSGALAQGIALLANNLDVLATAAGVVAVAFGGRLVAQLALATAAKVQAIVQSRQLAAAELQAARAAEAAAAAQLQAARAGVGAAGSPAAAEANLAAAQLRTAAATQAASIALTAKAAAMRAVNVAMAAFGGPVGLAVTALTLFVMWVTNSSKKAEELSKAVTAGFQPAIDTLENFNKETANAGFANLASSIQTLEEAKKEVQALADEYARMEATAASAGTGMVTPGFRQAMEEQAQAIEVAQLRVSQLVAGYERAVDVSADLVLSSAGITSANEAQRRSLEQLLERTSGQGQKIEQLRPLLVDWARKQYDVDTANRVAAASFDQVATAAGNSGKAIKDALKEVNEGLAQQINQVQLRLIEQTQGKAAAMRAGFLKELADQGIDPTSAEAQALRTQNEQLIALTASLDAATQATRTQKTADTEASRAAEERARVLEQQAEAQRRYADEAAIATAEIAGPLAVAEAQRQQRIAELDRELAAHNITQAAYNALVEQATRVERERAAEVAQAQAAPQALLDTMSGELRMLGAVGLERERLYRRLRAEEDMRQAVNEANRAGAKITAEMTAELVDQAHAYADLSIALEEHVANLNEWADVATRGVADFADLFADTLSGMRDGSQSAWDDIKDIFRRGWRDAIRTLLEQSVVRPFQNALQNLISGAVNGAMSGAGQGGWLSSLAGLIGGGSNLTGTGAMAASGGWAGALAGAGSMMGFGNNVSGLTSMAAGGGASGGGNLGAVIQIGGKVYQAVSGGGISGSTIAGASYLAAGAGALYGWNQGGDTAGKIGGAAAYGVAGYYGATAVGTVAAGYAAAGTAGAAAAGSAALGAIPVVGWIALAAIAIDKLSGGKLFGTDYKAKEVTQTIGVGAEGGTAAASVYEEGQKSLFRGKKRRTRTVDAGDEAREAADELYNAIDGVARSAAETLGLASVDIIAGSFQQVSDSKGKLKRSFSTILGKVYDESIEEFQQRLSAENVIAQIEQLDDTASAIAERWRSSATELLDGAQFLLAAVVDFNNGAGLLSAGGLERLTDLIEVLARGDETLTEAYQRVMAGASNYGSIAAAAYQDVATAGFSNFAKSLLQVRQEEKERIRALQEQAKALHGLSAREEDLAAVRAAAQAKTDALVASLESELVDLALNRINDQIEQLGGAAEGASSSIEAFINSLRLSEQLSPDTDATKRVTANDLMSAAALAGDADAFTQYAQQFLEVSRRLNASAAGYQADYDRVLQLAGRFGGEGSAASLEDLYAQRAALQSQQEAAARLERAQRIAQGVSDLAGVNGRDPLEILRSVTGLTPETLAGDLGLSVGELGDYLAAQQTDIGDLADILYELPRRIATELVTVLADREVPVAPAAGTVPTTGTPGASSSSGATLGNVTDPAALAALQRIEVLLQRQANAQELQVLR